MPDSNADIDSLIVATDSQSTIDSILDWVRLFGPRTFSNIGVPRAGMRDRHVLACNESECVLSAQAIE